MSHGTNTPGSALRAIFSTFGPVLTTAVGAEVAPAGGADVAADGGAEGGAPGPVGAQAANISTVGSAIRTKSSRTFFLNMSFSIIGSRYYSFVRDPIATAKSLIQ